MPWPAATNGHIQDNLIAERLAGATSMTPAAPNNRVYSNSLESLFGHFPTLEELADYAVEMALMSLKITKARHPVFLEFPDRP